MSFADTKHSEVNPPPAATISACGPQTASMPTRAPVTVTVLVTLLFAAIPPKFRLALATRKTLKPPVPPPMDGFVPPGPPAPPGPPPAPPLNRPVDPPPAPPPPPPAVSSVPKLEFPPVLPFPGVAPPPAPPLPPAPTVIATDDGRSAAWKIRCTRVPPPPPDPPLPVAPPPVPPPPPPPPPITST